MRNRIRHPGEGTERYRNQRSVKITDRGSARRYAQATGERLGQAGCPGPSKAVPQGAVAEAGFTSSSDGVRALSVTRNRNLAARSDKKPLPTESSSAGWFRTRVNRSDPEGQRLLLRTRTDEWLWRIPLSDRPAKNAERRDKRSARSGKDTWDRQNP
jgi:hypothetical protein